MRTLSLARLAVEAEGLRFKRRLRRVAVRASLGTFALIFVVSAIACIHIAGWFALSRYLAPAWSALVLAGMDLVIALIFAQIARGDLHDAVEEEAKETREAAVRQLRGQIATSLLIGRSMGLARYMLSRRSRA